MKVRNLLQTFEPRFRHQGNRLLYRANASTEVELGTSESGPFQAKVEVVEI